MIYVGTCGFSYDDWREVLYPPDLDKRDYLPRYASEFRALELNTTYYRLPGPHFLRSLGAKTPEGFRFIIKVFKGITHEIGPESASQLRQFLSALDPLKDQKKLAGVLLQFPYSFHYAQKNIDYINQLTASMGEMAVVVEFRNRQWFREETFSLLRRSGAGFCSVDEPQLKGLIPPEAIVTSERIGYIRFHGRNAAKWWEHEDPSERYDYLYSEDELTIWREKIIEMASKARTIYVMFNNHRGGKAVINARQMKSLLGSNGSTLTVSGA